MTMSDSDAKQQDLLRRIDRIESQLAIQQLPIHYALAVDGRDLDAWVALFVDDVNCGRHGRGRAVLRGLIEPQVRTFYRSVHQICGHAIDLIDSETATGKVYCRAEHEARGKWVVMAICYFDEYARRDGRWYFVRRKERHWYSTDVLERPGQPVFQNWDAWPDAQPELPHAFPTWKEFWDAADRKLPGELSATP
jgi:SnoaL-like domain